MMALMMAAPAAGAVHSLTTALFSAEEVCVMPVRPAAQPATDCWSEAPAGTDSAPVSVYANQPLKNVAPLLSVARSCTK